MSRRAVAVAATAAVMVTSLAVAPGAAVPSAAATRPTAPAAAPVSAAPAAAVPASAFDSGFDLRSRGLRGVVSSVAVMPDGTVLAGGRFTIFEDKQTVLHGVVRIRSNGMPDWAYTRPFDLDVNDIALAPDGSVIVVGRFQKADGMAAPGLVKLNPDGSVDTGFQRRPAGSPRYQLQTTSMNRSGEVGIGGAQGNVLTDKGYRLFPPSWLVEVENWESVRAAVLPGGELLMAADALNVSNDRGSQVVRDRLVRLTRTGAIDTSFTPPPLGSPVAEVVAAADGTAWVAGKDGTVLRLTPDGAVDGAFNAAKVSGEITSLSPTGDGGVVVAGGVSGGGFVLRLLADGSVDPSLGIVSGARTGVDGTVLAAAATADGKIVIGGDFDEAAGVPAPGLARIGSDAVPTTFSTSTPWPRRSPPMYYPLRVRARLACVVSNCGHKHNSPHGYWAIDWLGRIGDPVFPSGSGVVHIGGRFTGCAAGKDKKAGVWVWVDHGKGVTSRYYHLDSITVRNKQRVTPDTQIGTMGRTGAFSCSGQTAEAGYLHYELRVHGTKTKHRVPIGSLLACNDAAVVTYPEEFGTGNWNTLKPYVHWLSSTGTGCRPDATPIPAPTA